MKLFLISLLFLSACNMDPRACSYACNDAGKKMKTVGKHECVCE